MFHLLVKKGALGRIVGGRGGGGGGGGGEDIAIYYKEKGVRILFNVFWFGRGISEGGSDD